MNALGAAVLVLLALAGAGEVQTAAVVNVTLVDVPRVVFGESTVLRVALLEAPLPADAQLTTLTYDNVTTRRFADVRGPAELFGAVELRCGERVVPSHPSDMFAAHASQRRRSRSRGQPNDGESYECPGAFELLTGRAFARTVPAFLVPLVPSARREDLLTQMEFLLAIDSEGGTRMQRRLPASHVPARVSETSFAAFIVLEARAAGGHTWKNPLVPPLADDSPSAATLSCALCFLRGGESRFWPARWVTGVHAGTEPDKALRLQLPPAVDDASRTVVSLDLWGAGAGWGATPHTRPEVGARSCDPASTELRTFVDKKLSASAGTLSIPDPVEDLMKDIIDALVKPMVAAVGSDLPQEDINDIYEHTMASLSTVNVEEIVDVLSPTVARDVSNMATDSVTSFVGKKVTEDVTNKLSGSIVETVQDGAWQHIRDFLNDTLTRAISERMDQDIPEVMARTIPIELAKQLIHSVTHATVATLSHSLQDMRKVLWFHTQCQEEGLWCDYAKMSNKNYYSVYYSAYYSDVYANYYEPYYMEALESVDAIQNTVDNTQSLE